MKRSLLLIPLLFFMLTGYGQDTVPRFIKFFHVGEQLLPVHTLNISFQDIPVPRDADERVIDTLPPKSIVTDENSYNILSHYLTHATFPLGRGAGHLFFGTIKVIHEGKHFFVPGSGVTKYFKEMVAYLKKKNCDPQLIKAIIDNYPWIFNA